MSSQADLRRLVNAEANAKLSAQVAVLCASDARATGLLAAAATISGIGIAGALALKDNAPLVMACAGSALSAIGSAAASLWAIWPTLLDLPGWRPSAFEEDWGKPEEAVIQEMIPFVHDKIVANDQLIYELSRRSMLAMILMALTPICGLVGAGYAGTPVTITLSLLGTFAIGTVLFLFGVPEKARSPS